MKNKKSLGQHWLKNRLILDEIAELARQATTAKLCLEIGPGLGTLTSSLLKQFDEVVAIEYDEDLARKLPGQFPGKNLTVKTADILDFDLKEVTTDKAYVVAGNIPYYITSPIIHKLLTTKPIAQKIVLLIQKEVAERIAVSAGKHTLLSLFVQNFAEVELGPVVRASEFTPPPKVDSQVIILYPQGTPQISDAALDLAKQGFRNPRKKLASNLADHHRDKATWEEIFRELAINPNARPGDLDLWDWEELWQKCLE